MTTHVPAAQAPAPQTGETNYLNVSRGFWSWAGTLDHKRIGIMYLIGTTLAFLCGGLLAMAIRLHLWSPNTNPSEALFAPDTYNVVFTLHGVFMVFLFIIPAIPGALGNLVLPLMLGAKDVALPRLNLASFYRAETRCVPKAARTKGGAVGPRLLQEVCVLITLFHDFLCIY